MVYTVDILHRHPMYNEFFFQKKKFKTSGACDIHVQDKYCKLNASFVWMLSIQKTSVSYINSFTWMWCLYKNVLSWTC